MINNSSLTSNCDETPNPGEARMKVRKRREILTYGFAGSLGIVLGLILSLADRGDGDLFTGDWAAMTFDPSIAATLAITLLLAFIALPLWCFTQVDELVRERNLVAYTGGMMVVMGGVPAWAVLSAGGFVPYPTVAGVWTLGFAVTMITFGYTWIKSR